MHQKLHIKMKKTHNFNRRTNQEDKNMMRTLLFLFLLCCIKNSMIFILVVQPNSNYEVPTYLNAVLYNYYKFLSITYIPEILIIPCILNKFKLNSLVTSLITITIFNYIKISSYPNDGYFDYNLSADLNSNVYGQGNAINNLVRLLEYPKVVTNVHEVTQSNKKLHSGLQVILLSGGPGTGKSYIAKIIQKHYSAKSTITQIIPQVQPLYNTAFETQHKLLNINSGFGLIVIDFITANANDESISSYLKQLSIFCEKYKSDVFVILILQTLRMYSYNDIIGVDNFKTKEEYFNFVTTKTVEFKNKILKPISNITYNAIVLEPLAMSDVQKCIEESGKSKLNTLKLDPLQNSQNRNFVLGGCKDIH